MVRGVSGLRLAVALLGVGSPLTMYRMGLAKGAIGLPLRPMLTKQPKEPAEASLLPKREMADTL